MKTLRSRLMASSFGAMTAMILSACAVTGVGVEGSVGYDAGYYGYLWSKVYAQDMFSAFLKGGLENATVGQRYRTAILEPARTYEPDAEVARFLGRPMSPDAFYAEFGIAPPKK